MKKLLFLSLSAVVLTACTPKAYTDDMDAGKSALQKGNYGEAITKFNHALSEKKTNEAQNDLNFAENMQESMKLYHEGKFADALQSVNKALKLEQNDGSLPGNAKDLMAEINSAKTLSDSMKKEIVEGKTLLSEKHYDQATEMFKKVSTENSFPDVAPIQTMTNEAAKLATQSAIKQKKEVEQAAQTKKQETVQASSSKVGVTPKQETVQNPKESAIPSQQQKQQQQQQPSAALTHEEAENLVRQYLNIQPNQNVFVKYDHDASNGDYVVHVYEIVVDNPKTGEGHTSTWGWYGVKKGTKAVYDAMK